MSVIALGSATALGAIAAPLGAYAQEQGSGTLTGRVTDAETGAALAGARLSVEGQEGSTYSDSAGFFELSGIEPGSIVLITEFLGYPDQRSNGTVQAGGLAQINVSMGGDLRMGAVVVQGQLSEMNKSLSQERAADSLVSIAAADVIGQFPDRNIAETLQRVSGVTLRSQTGEGSFAVLRGVLPQLSTATVNGQRLQSVQSEGRETRLGYIWSGTVERVEVDKVFTAEKAGDFIGGNINVVTKSALDVSGPYLGGSFEMGRVEAADDEYYEFELTGANSFADDKLGVLFSFNVAERPQQTEGVVSGLTSSRRIDPSTIDLLTVFGIDPDPTTINVPASATSFSLPFDVTLAQNELTAERVAGSLDVDFRPNADQRYRFLANFTQLEETRLLQNSITSNGLLVGSVGYGAATTVLLEAFRGPQDMPSFHAVTPIIFAQNQPREVFNGNLAVLTEQRLGEFDVEGSLGFGRAKIDSTNFQFGAGFILDGSSIAPFSFGFDFTDTTFPDIVVPAAAASLIEDPASYNQIFEAKRRTQDGVEEELFGRIDFSREIEVGGRPTTLKFGYAGTSKDKRTDVDTVQYVTALNAGQGAPTAVPPLVSPDLFTAAFSGNQELNDDLADGRYAFGPYIDLGAAEQWFLTNFDAGIKTDQSAFESALRDFEATETTHAIYGQLNVEMATGIEVIGGLRVEDYETDMNSFIGIFGAPSQTTSSSNSETMVLPSLVLRAELSDDLLFRAGASQTYARPTFEQLAPRAQFNPLGGTVGSVGNPDLEPIRSLNLDLSLDYYTTPLGVVRAGVYYKQLDDLIVDVQRTLAIDETFRGVAPAAGTAWTIGTLENASDGNIFGLELGFQRMFPELPGILKGAGLSANYLYTDSELNIDDPVSGLQRMTSLELASGHSGNISLLYDHAGFKGRLAYRYQGEALFRLGATSDLDRYFDAREQLDISLQYEIGENWAIFVEGFNLTDEPFRTYQGSESIHKESELQGRQFGGGFRFRF